MGERERERALNSYLQIRWLYRERYCSEMWSVWAWNSRRITFQKLIRYPIPNSSAVRYVRHKQWLSKISRCYSHSFAVLFLLSFAKEWINSGICFMCRNLKRVFLVSVMKWSWKFSPLFSFLFEKKCMLYRKQTYQSVHNGNYMTIRYNPLITLAIKPTALISNDFHFYLARNWNFLRLSAVCLSMFVVHLYPIRPHSKESCYRSLDWPCFNYDTVRIYMLNIKPLAFIIVCLGCVLYECDGFKTNCAAITRYVPFVA